MYLKNLITSFPVAKYRFIIQPKEDIIFSNFKGSTLCGAFGYTLKRICCVAKNKDCTSCLLKTKCVYSIIFEAKISNAEYKILGYTEPPRPFVIEPPIDEKTKYSPNETIEFSILIFGNSMQFLPYIIYTFYELGKKGIGETRAKYELLSVGTYDGKKIYDVETQTLHNIDSAIKLSFDGNYKDLKEIKIKFLTPTRIKINNKYTTEITFQTLIRLILRRLAGLFLFYFDKKLDGDFETILKEAESVNTKYSSIKWVDLELYSTRQKTKMKLGGIIGEVAYEGDITSFVPLIKIGELTHIGKNTTIGLGKYEVIL